MSSPFDQYGKDLVRAIRPYMDDWPFGFIKVKVVAITHDADIVHVGVICNNCKKEFQFRMLHREYDPFHFGMLVTKIYYTTHIGSKFPCEVLP